LPSITTAAHLDGGVQVSKRGRGTDHPSRYANNNAGHGLFYHVEPPRARDRLHWPPPHVCVHTRSHARTSYCGGSRHKHSIHTTLPSSQGRVQSPSLQHARCAFESNLFQFQCARVARAPSALPLLPCHFTFFTITTSLAMHTHTQKEISQTMHLGERTCAHLLPCSPYPGLSAREVPTECTGQKSRSAIPSAAPWDCPPCTPRAHAHNKVDARTHTRSYFVGTWQTTNGTTPSLLHSRCFLGIHLPSRGSCRQWRSRFPRCLCDASLV
jgi:hypothetical protein